MPKATYVIGGPSRPPIHHDNGFLERFARRAPNQGDYASLRNWYAMLELGEAAQGVPFIPHNDIPDGLAAYRHYLFGRGKPRTFSYERYVAHDSSGATTLAGAIRDAKLGAQGLYSQFFAGRAEFSMTSTALPCGGKDAFPYPATENWQKAIGGHMIWLSANVNVTKDAGGPRFKMALLVHAEDMYNFNPDDVDIVTGIPDSANGRFQITGLAMQYMHYAQLQRTVSWSHQGEEKIESEADGRGRQPNDNRRLRNRL